MEELSVVIKQKNGVIDFSNFEELKKQLSGYLEEYKSMSFTEERKAEAKSAMVDLRKLKKAVNDRKIEVKKQCMQPYDEFEVKTKELLTLIDEPILLIDSQVQAFEKKRIAERKQIIQEIYVEKSGDLAEYATLSSVYSDKWENSSTSKKKIEEELEQAFLGVRMDVESLKLMRVNQDIVQYALEQYKKGNTAVESMKKANEFAELTERMEKAEAERKEREAKEMEARIRKEEEAVAVAKAVAEVQEPEKPFHLEMETGFDLPFVTPSTKAVKYRMVATESEISDLEMYMNSVGIGFERIG